MDEVFANVGRNRANLGRGLITDTRYVTTGPKGPEKRTSANDAENYSLGSSTTLGITSLHTGAKS